jgi:uncharacterized membrane protein
MLQKHATLSLSHAAAQISWSLVLTFILLVSGKLVSFVA